MRVVGTNILVKIKQEEEEQKTNGGLYIPKTVSNTYTEGEVVAVGQAEGFVPEVEVGETVVFPKVKEDAIIDGMFVLPHKDILYVREQN